MNLNALFARKPQLVSRAEALPGRDQPIATAARHLVFGTPLSLDLPEGAEEAVFGMGCFWGSEEIYWRLPGVYTTAVGYQGGYTPHPTYEEVCSGRTGHTEAVLVAYRESEISTYDVLRHFWENHDPTSGYRQGNDVGTQYRSAIYWTTDEQRDLVERTAAAYGPLLAQRGYPAITTQVAPANDWPFYFAEGYHQQYLYKVPNGYRCHANTGLALPAL